MGSVKLIRVILKDILDLVFIFSFSCLLLFLSLVNLGVSLSADYFIFPEKILDLFLDFPVILFLFIICLLLVCIVYYLVNFKFFGRTLGMCVTNLNFVGLNKNYEVKISHVLGISVGVFLSMIFFFIGYFYSWWIDPEYRGLAEHLAQVKLIKSKSAS